MGIEGINNMKPDNGHGYMSQPCPNCGTPAFYLCHHKTKNDPRSEFVKVTCFNCCGIPKAEHKGYSPTMEIVS